MRHGLLRALAGILARTWRIDVDGEAQVRRLRRASVPLVFAVWHSQLLAPLWHRRGEGITLLVSGHTDGGYLAGAAIGWGYDVIRGSSTRGGATSARQLVRVLSAGGDVAFTPDGPRGPAYEAKSGAVAVARHTKAVIVPVGAVASSAWTLKSWDRFVIPRPFARVRIVYGRPLRVHRRARAEGAVDLENALTAAWKSAGC